VQNFSPSGILAHNIERVEDEVHTKCIYGVKRSIATESSTLPTACPPVSSPLQRSWRA